MSADTIAAEPHLDLTESVIDAVKRVAAEEIMPRYLKVAHQRKADGSLEPTATEVRAQGLAIEPGCPAGGLPFAA